MEDYRQSADKYNVKKYFFGLIILLLPALPLAANRILYAEQYYNLYHLHFYQYPDDTMESIYYLELALKANFCNPLYALARIKDTKQWEHYRYLFKIHLNLKLVQLYLTLGSKWDKQIAFFYNYPWKRENLESLETAETIYKQAFYYWDEARNWARKLQRLKYHLEQIQNWEDEFYRMTTGELDYKQIINEQLTRLQKVRRDFEAMDKNTY